MGKERKSAIAIRAALALVGAFLLSVCGASGQGGQSGAQHLRVLWDRPVGSPARIAVTPDGGLTAVLGKNGLLTCYDSHGSVLWRNQTDGANSIAVSRSGKTVLAYAALNPARRVVTAFAGAGKVLGARNVPNCIWSAAVSDDGATAVVGTGKRRMLIYSVGTKRVRRRRCSLPGIPMSIAFTPGGKSIVVGMWQDSGVGLFTLTGKRAWSAKGEVDLQYTAEVSQDGCYILETASPNRPAPRNTLTLRKYNGEILWRKRLDKDDMRAAPAPGGGIVGVSYRRRIVSRGKTMSERRLALFDKNGALLWEKGGLFFKPELVTFLAGNCVLVSSGNKTLYLLDSRGKIISTFKAPALIRSYEATPAANGVLIYCGDGRIYMVSASS